MLQSLLASLVLFIFIDGQAQQQLWIEYHPDKENARQKHIVLISGDEEYRSEEALPMLAQILSKKHGFRCTVLFAIDPANGSINPDITSNIPGLEHLDNADLMVIFTRFRNLPEQQMSYIDKYLKAGKPVVGIRTATHAFNFEKDKKNKFAHYDYQSKKDGWKNGFGKKILGETWISHHGDHGKEGTRALVNGMYKNAGNVILNGVRDIWCPSDVYTTADLPPGARVLLYGQPTAGMTASSPANLDKSIMPVAWTMLYEVSPGKKGRAFTSTMGAAVDLQNEDLRRLLVNACFWAMNLEKQIPKKADVSFISSYKPTMFGFDGFQRGLYPSNYAIK